jgi:hypothetical protein
MQLARLAALLAVLCASCSHSTAPTLAGTNHPEPDRGVLPSMDARDASRGAPPVDSGAALVEHWNDAHNRHDANALTALYAPTVGFYGLELSGAACVDRKRAALAGAPDYQQVISDVELAPVDANNGTFVRLTKKTTSKGASKSFTGFLYVIDSRIVAEGDRVVDALGTRYTYCYAPSESTGPAPNDVRPGQAKVSGLEAMLVVRHSKGFAALAGHPTLELRDCAHGCAPGDFGTCRPDTWVPFFVVALDGAGHEIVAFTIDPITKTISRVEVPRR